MASAPLWMGNLVFIRDEDVHVDPRPDALDGTRGVLVDDQPSWASAWATEVIKICAQNDYAVAERVERAPRFVPVKRNQDLATRGETLGGTSAPPMIQQ